MTISLTPAAARLVSAPAPTPTPTPTPTPAPTPPAPTPPAPTPSAQEVQVANAMRSDAVMQHIVHLSAVPRVSGTPQFLAAANYVAEQARAAGFEASVVPHSGGKLFNVIAERKGTAVGADRKLVIAGAHLDSVPRGPGANDNASGSATLIEIARTFAKLPTANDIRLIWFDGEERGLLGSSAYVREHASDITRAVAMLNTDMIGSPNGDVGFSLGSGTSSAIGDAIRGVALRNNITATFRPERHNRSDHAAFDRAGVPSAHFGVSVRTVNKDDPNYHRPSDTADKINKVILEQSADLLALSVLQFANETKRLLEPRPPRGIHTETGPPL